MVVGEHAVVGADLPAGAITFGQLYDTFPFDNRLVRISITAEALEQGIANGEFKANWNAKEFGIKAFAMIEGGSLISRVSGSNDQINIIINAIKREIEEHSI